MRLKTLHDRGLHCHVEMFDKKADKRHGQNLDNIRAVLQWEIG